MQYQYCKKSTKQKINVLHNNCTTWKDIHTYDTINELIAFTEIHACNESLINRKSFVMI